MHLVVHAPVFWSSELVVLLPILFDFFVLIVLFVRVYFCKAIYGKKQAKKSSYRKELELASV